MSKKTTMNIKKTIKDMTLEEKKELASHMLNNVKWCRGYRVDDQCNCWYMHDGVEYSEFEHNKIMNEQMRKANPKWSEEALYPYLRLTEEDHLTGATHSTLVILLMALQETPTKADDLLKLALKHFPDNKAYQAAVMKLYRAKIYDRLAQVCQTMREELRRS